MSLIDNYFIKVSSFLDFARFACYRKYPLPVLAHQLHDAHVLSCRLVLSNSILSFFTDLTKDGRYLLYDPLGGKEHSDIVVSTEAGGQYSPIIYVEKTAFPVRESKRLKDKFLISKIRDLDSLARLTYDPSSPEEYDVTLIAFPYKKKWIIGYITIIELDDIRYCFNYVELDFEPSKPFLKYSAHEEHGSELTSKFQHGYSYLPIVKLVKPHPIFGLK